MNKIETLPKQLVYDGIDYAINLHINAWGNIVICYRSMFKCNGNYIDIFPYCVEYKNKPYIPKIFVAGEYTGLNEHIGNCKTLDDCIDAIENAIDIAVKNGEVTIK